MSPAELAWLFSLSVHPYCHCSTPGSVVICLDYSETSLLAFLTGFVRKQHKRSISFQEGTLSKSTYGLSRSDLLTLGDQGKSPEYF